MGVLLFRAGQAGGMHQQEPLAKAYLGQHSKDVVRIDWLERAGQERPRGPDRHELNVGQQCAFGREGQWHTGLHWNECQQLKGSDPSPLPCAEETHLECWVWF